MICLLSVCIHRARQSRRRYPLVLLSTRFYYLKIFIFFSECFFFSFFTEKADYILRFFFRCFSRNNNDRFTRTSFSSLPFFITVYAGTLLIVELSYDKKTVYCYVGTLRIK